MNSINAENAVTTVQVKSHPNAGTEYSSEGMTNTERINEKIAQNEPLVITEKLILIWNDKLALIVSFFLGLLIPVLAIACRLFAEGIPTNANLWIGNNMPPVVWLWWTIALTLVSLRSVFFTLGLICPPGNQYIFVRCVVCLGAEFVWLAVYPQWRGGNGADKFLLYLLGFEALLILFSNALFYGSRVAESRIKSSQRLWQASKSSQLAQLEQSNTALEHKLATERKKVATLRDWFAGLQTMVDDCPSPRSGSCVLEITRRRRDGDKGVRHELSLRPDDVKRTKCREHKPVVLSDPLLDCPTEIGLKASPVDGASAEGFSGPAHSSDDALSADDDRAIELNGVGLNPAIKNAANGSKQHLPQ